MTVDGKNAPSFNLSSFTSIEERCYFFRFIFISILWAFRSELEYETYVEFHLFCGRDTMLYPSFSVASYLYIYMRVRHGRVSFLLTFCPFVPRELCVCDVAKTSFLLSFSVLSQLTPRWWLFKWFAGQIIRIYPYIHTWKCWLCGEGNKRGIVSERKREEEKQRQKKEK